jgi:hypothetical protein
VYTLGEFHKTKEKRRTGKYKIQRKYAEKDGYVAEAKI